MRYNASELKQIAVTSGEMCSKEGVLSLKEKEGKLWNKTDVLTERWCRLVDNLFFYFKTREMTSDPHGVFVLEGSRVKLDTDSKDGRGFILEFDGVNRSTYFLASEASEAREWIKALEGASYSNLKQKYELLMHQQKEMQRENAQQDGPQTSLVPQPAIRETRSANNSPMLRRKKLSPTERDVTLSDFEGAEGKLLKKKQKKHFSLKKILPPDTTFPVLEFAISCSELNITKTIEHKRLLKIRVLSLQSPATDWTRVFDTESVKAATSVEFTSTASFYQSHLVTPHTELRFLLCQIKDNNTTDLLGFATCVVSDLFFLNKPLTLSIERQDNSIGRLRLQVIREYVSSQVVKSSSESQLSSALLSSNHSSTNMIRTNVDSSYGDIGQVPNLKSLYCEAISRTYRFPTASGDNLSIQEIMLETRLSFHIPLLYLKLLIDQDTRHVGTLNSIKYLAERLQVSRKKQIENKGSLIQQYQEGVKNIIDRSKTVSFKASIQKTEKQYEFIPTNLHLQRMRVQQSDCMSAASLDNATDSSASSTGVYDIVTVGAATAHCLKYKQGGLLSIISSSSEKVKKGKELVLQTILNQDDKARSITELPVLLPELQKKVNSLISTLQTLLSAGKECNTVPNRTSAESSLSSLSDMTCKLVSLLDNGALCEALHVLLNQSNGKSSAANLVAAATSLVSASVVEWEELKNSVKTKLSDIVKKIHSMLDAADDLLALDHENSSPPPFDDILKELSELSSRLDHVTNLAMQGHAVHVMQSVQDSPELIYRRDVVFSQVLTSCVCGVATSLASLLHDTEYLDCITKHGMLIHFESLLSTYKNELGMLEDYVVGVYDLSKVTFYCDRAPEQQGENVDHLLPTLHGTRNKVFVRLHLDSRAFAKLPESLKSGASFKLVPVIFTVGINEEQTLADKIGKTSLQEYVNMDSYTRLCAYCESTKQIFAVRQRSLEDRLKRLGEAVHSKKNKNVEILHLASEICRSAKGVRVTSCKSAKDRTAMSVTLEQVQVLLQNHDLSQGAVSNALACMRSEGTRRENTRKNVGVRKYAFTSVQLMTFPKQYKPPDGTYGKTES